MLLLTIWLIDELFNLLVRVVILLSAHANHRVRRRHVVRLAELAQINFLFGSKSEELLVLVPLTVIFCHWVHILPNVVPPFGQAQNIVTRVVDGLSAFVLQTAHRLVGSIFKIVAKEIKVLACFMIQRLVEGVRWVNECMLHIKRCQLISIEGCIVLHSISEGCAVHVLAAAWVLWHTELMERWQFLDLQLIVVWEWN